MTPEGLLKAAMDRKSIVGVLGTTRPIPAAFLVNMSFVFIMHRIGRAKIYKPKPRVKRKPTWFKRDSWHWSVVGPL